MNKKRKIYLIIAIVLFIGGLVLSNTYRPYIYENHINDCGFADTIGSLISVMACCFFLWSTKDYPIERRKKQIIYVTLVYAILWEFFGLLGIHGTFDWKDIIAAIFSGILTYILMMKLETKSTTANRVDGSASS